MTLQQDWSDCPIQAAVMDFHDGFVLLKPILDKHQSITDFSLEYLNKQAQAMFGAENPSYQTGSLLLSFPLLQKNGIFEICKQVYQHKQQVHQDLFYQGDKVTGWFRATLSYSQGMIAAVFRDITEEKALEQNLNSTTGQLMATMENITDAYFSLDQDWRFTYVNARAEDLLLQTRKQLIGQCVWDKFPESVGSTFQQQYFWAVEHQQPVQFEEYYPPLNRWFLVNASPFAEGIAVYFTDISDRKKIEDTLRESEAMFRSLAESIPNIVWRADEQGQTTYYNQQWYEYTGMPKEASLKNWLDAIHPDDQAQTKRKWREAVKSGKPYEVQYRLRNQEGEYFWFYPEQLPFEMDREKLFAGLAPARTLMSKNSLKSERKSFSVLPHTS